MFTYPFKQGKDILPKLLNFNYWPQHSIWKLLLLLNMKLLNIIGKHCSIENTFHLWQKTEFICNRIVPFMILRGKRYHLYSPDRCVHIISQAIYLSFIAVRNGYLKSKLIIYRCFLWFFCRFYRHTCSSVYSAVLPFQER